MNIRTIINNVPCYILVLILSFICLSNTVSAETKTFIKEYTYQASDEDSKNSSRTIALREVKRLLLEELGTYLESQSEVKNFQITKDQITVLTAGIISTEVMEDKWDGKAYWLKANISANPQDVIKSIDSLRKDREKSKELAEIAKRSAELLKENERLRKELLTAKGEKKKETIDAYNQTINDLTAAEWFEKGYADFVNGKFAEAITSYNKAIELNPQNARFYSSRGVAFSNLGNKNQAIKDCDKAIELDPKDARAFSRRGGAYASLGNASQAIKDCDKAIKLDPKDSILYVNRGNAYGKLGNTQRAIKDYDKAIELNPQDARAYISRGVAYYKLGNTQQEIKDYNKAIELNPQNAGAYYNRGNAYGRLGNTQQAIDDYKIAARLGDKLAQDFLKSKGVDW